MFFLLSKYCPAGCKAVAGDVSGDKSEGYRHVSTNISNSTIASNIQSYSAKNTEGFN